jgi:N-acetylmuramoyl-L-alanine amidase
MFTRLESVNRILLSAGHGGLAGESYDPGATFQGYSENTEVKQIISRLLPKLTSRGLVVVAIPDYGLSRTISYINAQYDFATDWGFEIHKDSAESYSLAMSRRMGVYYHPTSLDSSAIASRMVNSFKNSGASQSSWSRPDNASNHGTLGWIRKPKMLTHLIECGFMQDSVNNEADEFYAKAIATAILSCIG